MEEKEVLTEENGPYKVYETKEAWQEAIDAIIGSRLKDYRETKESMEALSPIVEELKELSGADSLSEIPEKMKEKMVTVHRVDMEALKEEFPKENLEKLEENEHFQLAIRAGLTPSEAVTLALLSAKKEETVPNKKPVEESVMHGAKGMMVRITPSKMSFRELDEISARVARGEKISF